ncbi:MAG: dihydropteroate synthase-like protein [Candidatus Thorarchaeota archaeon]
MKILIITGQSSYPTINKITHPIKEHFISIFKAPISISAFLTEKMTADILKNQDLSQFNLILLPGFIQWNTTKLEKEFSIEVRKGPEFASDLPVILKNLDEINLSNKVPANKLFKISGEKEYQQIVRKEYERAKNNISYNTFYINKEKSELMIGRNLPPLLIAEIVNSTEKSDKKIVKKVKHYIESGADIIDIGCVSNKPKPDRIQEIIKLINKNFNVLISIDSMEEKEIFAAADQGIDMILSLDAGNYKNCLNLPKEIPLVILPTNVRAAYFPKDPEIRVKNLIELTKSLYNHGFKKVIADPLLETPISPGICNSLESYFLYKKTLSKPNYKKYELPMFFGVSNVVELMDIDSVGINGLLASIAIELDIGVLFTVEHSTKLMGGVRELKDSIKLSYLAKYKKAPPINLGINVFKAKKKKSQETPKVNKKDAIIVNKLNLDYKPDESGYFRIYINHYSRKIYVLFYSNEHHLIHSFIGENAEALSKKIIQSNLTNDLYHLNYLGRELNKAESCLLYGKAYIQDE